ncbi:hypothetical protein OC25_19710 [Pedobacter kyungheensis]|uniref:DUF4843 domain-containing protein n=1 Tax=Pedobacter kyungheensis TaxID=1069985 RepID=A0A0C1D4E1_9SPHI|nr:DUF4843 domain-containing protein [Pedobacter kyungheensis]KIA91846.1 hypothetical protein OC25_19710 [Pedobacter kyungheensis]
MKKNIVSIIAFMVTLVMLSCEKPLNTYDSKDSIYFNDAARLPLFSGEVIKDSTIVSFSLAKSQDSVVNMVVSTTGAKSSQDRPYNLTVNTSSTAKEGVHFEILNKSFSIKKNQLKDTVKIKFLRKADMQTNTFLLSFDLLENENFITGMNNKVTNQTTGKKISYINYRWYVNDIIKKPARWLDTYLGTFTRKKLLLMVSVLNIDPAYLDTSVSIAEMVAYAKYMQRYLNDQKLQGNTILEDDGSIMIMGPSVQ